MNYCYRIPRAIHKSVERIVVLGDIHGDWQALYRSLLVARLIDIHHRWVGEQAHLVQIGDMVDRGGRSTNHGDEKSEQKIIQFLVNLKNQAQKKGGDVHIMIGNHELMNVMGDFRYVSPMGMNDFNGLREESFKPGGVTSTLLACNASSIVKIGKWVFAHAGIVPEISGKFSIEQINTTIRDFLLGNIKIDKSHEVMDVFWNRDFSLGNPSTKQCSRLRKSLKNLDAQHMAVGHTIQEGGINSACNNSVWRVDTGMSNAFGKSGRIQLLEILNNGKSVNVIQ